MLNRAAKRSKSTMLLKILTNSRALTTSKHRSIIMRSRLLAVNNEEATSFTYNRSRISPSSSSSSSLSLEVGNYARCFLRLRT